MNTPICDFVRDYAARQPDRLHMPGHKGRGAAEQLDITEIAGADVLYHPTGIILESEKNAAALFGSRRTVYSAEGSSLSIRAMVFLAVQDALKRGKTPRIAAGRNAHKVFITAAALLDVQVQWLYPAQSESLLTCQITPEALEEALRQGESVTAVYITSPDYLGNVADIAGLSRVCRRYGCLLLVDNAHGAYQAFLGAQQHPMAQGADLCCDSAHKTLPVVTGGAYLHLAHDAPVQDEAAVRGALALFGSTSPSYLILQSLDACNAVLAGDYPRRLVQCCVALEGLRRSLNKAAAARQCPVPLAVAGAQQEPMKLTLDAAALGCTGTALADALRRAQLECEYADPRYVVLMFTPENPPQDYTRLQATLEQLLAAVPAVLPRPENRAGEFAALQQQAVQRCTIRQAVLGAQVRIPVHKALGRVCAMPTVSCPPAIPVAVSGEEITPAAIALMQRYGIEELSVLR